MATTTDLDAKRVELNTAINDYKQAVLDFQASTITQVDLNAAKAETIAKGDEYAKLAGQVKKDNPTANEDTFFSNPGFMSELTRNDVATIMTTGSFFGGGMKLLVDTEGNAAGATNVILSFASGSNLQIDWGDGSSVQPYTGAASHNYATPGQYTVQMKGTVNGFTNPLIENRTQIKDVQQWGSVEFASIEGMFRRRTGFVISAADAPVLLPGCSMAYMFYATTDFNSSIGHWDVSNVVNMRSMFSYAEAFNQPIDNWNVSGVLDFYNMFFSNSGFNQPLNSWVFAVGANLGGMFRDASAFNQPLNNWDVSVISAPMTLMFANTTDFNQDISGWDVSNVSSAVQFRKDSALITAHTPFAFR
jgi:hypothetical protein